MDLHTKLELKVTGNASKVTELTSDDAKAEFLFSLFQTLLTGTGANQMDLAYADEGQIAASGSQDFDLDTSLTDAFGDAADFARVKLIIAQNVSSDAAAVLQLGGGTGGIGTNAFDTWITANAADGSEGLILRAGGFAIIGAVDAIGYAVTAATGDILHLEEIGTSVPVDYKLWILGATV